MSDAAETWQVDVDRRAAQLVGDERVGVELDVDADRIRRAYRRTANDVRRTYPTVYLGARILPRARREAIYAVAAFIMRSDALSEGEGEAARAAWARWCTEALAEAPTDDDDVLVAFADVRRRYRIPRSWVAEELEGLAVDQRAPAYQSFDDLVGHCFDALAPVGLMMLRVLGVSGEEAELNAVRLAVAMQLSDVLTDIAEDVRDGRRYLPARELAQLGVDVDEVVRCGPSPAWRRFLRDLIARNREMFSRAEGGLLTLPLAGALTTTIIGSLHLSQLADIEASGFDVFRRPPGFRPQHLWSATGAALRLCRARLARARATRIWSVAV